MSAGAKLLPRIKKGVDEVHTYRGRLRIVKALVLQGEAPALHMNRAKLVLYRAGPQRHCFHTAKRHRNFPFSIYLISEKRHRYLLTTEY